MADATVYGKRGKTISWKIAVTKPDAAGARQPVDLSLANTQLRVTTRRRRSDAAAYHYKTLGVAGGPGGVEVVAGVAAHNVAQVTLAPNETQDAAATLLGVWEAELTEPDGTVTDVASGTFKLQGDVRRGNAP